MEKKTWVKLIIIVLLIVVVATGLYLRWSPVGQSYDPLERWGKGNLTISEGAYYSSKLNFIIESWQHSRKNAENESNGRLKDSYKTFFIIDLDEQALWIENNGRIEKETYAKLPVGMKWTLYHFTPQGNTELPGRTILKMRGLNSSQQTPEQFTLIGAGRDSYLCFDFNSSSRGSGHGAGSYNKPSFSFRSSSTNTDGLYGSIAVTQDEYQQYRNSLPDSTSLKTDEENTQSEIISELEKNKEAWHRIAKSLYIEIDRQLQKACFELTSIEIEPGSDFSVAHAEIRGSKDSILRRFFGGVSSVEAYLNIDYLGNNIWYAKSTVHPHRPIPPHRKLDIEFLVCPQGDVPNSMEKEFIEKGHQKQQQHKSIPETNWRAVLANGAIVEFIGIWENAGTGKQWWGPDGGSLGYTPYYACEPDAYFTRAKKFYEIAWRIHWPSSTEAVAVESMCEGCIGSYSRKLTDRYGNDLKENLVSSQGFAFEESLDKTNFAVWLPGQYEQRVIFKNISLIPGKNQGFEIE